MMYQQQSGQTPPSAVSYHQTPPHSMQSNNQQRSDQQGTQMQMQQHNFMQEQPQSVQAQPKNPLDDNSGDFAMQDLGANIADCGEL